MTGRVSLYFDGAIVATRKYNAIHFRDSYIEMWKKVYGKGFDKAQVVDAPDPPSLKKQKMAEKTFVPERSSYKKGYIKPAVHVPKKSTKTFYNERF